MNLCNYLLKVLSLLSLLFSASTAFTAPQVKTYKKHELQSYLGADFLFANQTFDESGSQQSLISSSDHYYLLEMPFGFRYSFTDSWAARIEMQFAYAESKSSDPIYRATRTNSSVNALRLGTDFLLMENPIELIPEFEFLFPFEKVKSDTDNVITSEGVMEFTAALRAQQGFGSFVTFGRIGYTYRAEGRSHLLPYSLAGGYQGTSTLFGLAVSGFQSITDDTDKNNQALRNGTIIRTNAGVRRFYATNPSVMDLDLFVNMNLSPRWSFDLNFGYYVMGNNFAQGPHVGAMITLNSELFKKDATQQRHRPMTDSGFEDNQLSTDKDINMFKEETQDGVDQKLFKPAPNPRPKPAKQLVTKKKPRVRQSTAPSDEQLQNQLDNTEMKIQLKKNK